jgi:hypothetical protein
LDFNHFKRKNPLFIAASRLNMSPLNKLAFPAARKNNQLIYLANANGFIYHFININQSGLLYLCDANEPDSIR